MTLDARQARCPACALVVPELALSCPGCSSPLREAQRRVVTMVFVDLEGYTGLSERLDPEDVHVLVRPFMNRLRSLCEDLGGVVQGIEGDGFLAVFGAMSSSEDDPSRALKAAVEMQLESKRRRGSQLPGLRVAVHAGEVLVAPSWEPGGFSLAGDPVNVASRLCGQARTDEVLVSAAVIDLVPWTQRWSEARELVLRGRDGPTRVATLEWESVQSRGVASLPTASVWVSRAELAVVTEAARQGSVLVVGDAGMGKTALAAQWVTTSGAERALWARGTSFGDNSGYSLLNQLCAGLSAEDLANCAPVHARAMRHFAGDPVDTVDEAAVSGLVPAALAGLQSLRDRLVIVVDDAHWLDDSALDVVAGLRGGPRVIAVSRNGDLSALGDATVVSLGPLAAPEAAALIDVLLPGAPSSLRDLLLERCGGIPLYLEQCSHWLVEDGVVEIDSAGCRLIDRQRLRQVPTSMRLFVSARLDVLSVGARRVVEVASVLGDAPDHDLLRYLLGDIQPFLDELRARGLLRTGASGAWSFSHALVRDVAYEGQLRSRRADVHRAAAEWYAVLPVATVLEEQARHLEAAVRLGDADCGLVRRAVEAMVVFSRSVVDERPRTAQEVVLRAEQLAALHPTCEVDLLLLDLVLSAAAETTGDVEVAVARAASAAQAAKARGDRLVEAEALWRQGRAAPLRDPDAARALLEQAGEIYASAGERMGMHRVAVDLAIAREAEEGIAPHLAALEASWEAGRRLGDVRGQAWAAQQLALHAYAEGSELFALWRTRAMDTARKDDLGLEHRLKLAEAALASFGLDLERSAEAAARAAAGADEVGVDHVLGNALVLQMEAAVLTGDIPASRALIDRASQVASTRASRSMSFTVDVFTAHLEQRAGSGDTADALLAALDDHPLADAAGSARDLAECRAWVLLERGDFAQARAVALRAAEIDDRLRQPYIALRPRLLALQASCAAGVQVGLSEVTELRRDCEVRGAPILRGLVDRAVALDDVLQGYPLEPDRLNGTVHDLGIDALDVELNALSTRDPSGLLTAAGLWRRRGDSIWWARSLLWHTELTGTSHAEVGPLLARLGAPLGIDQVLRSQVRGLQA